MGGPERLERLGRADGRFIILCLAIMAAGGVITASLFHRAFPEASIEFKVGRPEARTIAEKFLARHGIRVAGDRFAGIFDADEESKVFLERTLGLERANQAYQDPVKLWRWQLRWFAPLRKDEVRVAVTPLGEVVGFRRELDEDAAGGRLERDEARGRAEAFLATDTPHRLEGLTFIEASSQERPNRRDHSFVWEKSGWKAGEATLRVQVDVLGDSVGVYRQYLQVPEQWTRDYENLRSKNQAAGAVASFLYVLTGLGALIFLIRFARLGDVPWRTISAFAGVGAILTFFNALNSIPLALYEYDTTQSFGAFLGNTVVMGIMSGLGVACWIALFGAAGEPLYRRMLPRAHALGRYLTPAGFRSKSFLKGLLLGYALTAFFMAYQAVFYVVATRFGAWAPAETPYSNLLNTQFPWITVLLIGFLPAVTEEFSNRMFSVPFYHRLTKNRWVAILAAGFVWGFLHAGYPNQPFYIRGLEVGLAGCLIGALLLRFGIFPLLVWHFSVDALYTALLLLRSNNLYYVLTGGFAALILIVPLIVAIVFYLRRGGFRPEEDLTNQAADFVPEAPSVEERRVEVEVPRRAVSGRLIAIAGVALLLAIAALAWRTNYPPRRLVYPAGREAAARLAREFVASHGTDPDTMKMVVYPSAGFDRFEEDLDNLPPDRPDGIATRYVSEKGGLSAWERLAGPVLSASVWEVRLVRPLRSDEWNLSVDPRRGAVIGFHHSRPEEAPGADLDEAAARGKARELIEAMRGGGGDWREVAARSDKRPHRRDWTFVFADSGAAVGGAIPRLTVGLAGDEPAGYGVTLQVPEEYARERSRTTPLSTLLMVVRIVLLGGLLGLIVLEVIAAAKRDPIPWRRLVRAGLLLAVPSLLAQLNRFPVLTMNYQSQIPWNIFLLTGAIGLLLRLLIEVVLLVMAIAAIQAARPRWLAEIRPAHWPAQASHAIVVAVMALALGAFVDRLELLGRITRPELFGGPTPPTPAGYRALVPGLELVWTVITGAVMAGGLIAGLSLVLRNALARPAARIGLALLTAFALGPDHVRSVAEAVFPTLFEALALTVALLVAFRAARGNVLAYLAILPLALGGQKALALIAQPDAGMALQGWIAFVILSLPVAGLIAAAFRRSARPG